MSILEQRYQNTGYAFWFKLLEILGDSDGHYFRVGNPADLAYLGSYTHTTPETATEILDLLALLDAIDPVLWAEKCIWVQNFVDGLVPVYAKRDTEIPHKPNSLPGNDANNDSTGLPTPGIHIGEESIEEKSIGIREERACEETSVAIWKAEPVLSKATWSTFETHYGTIMPGQDKQIDAINRIITMASDRGVAEIIVAAMMKKLLELKKEDTSTKGFWRNQPYLPSTLASLWSQVWEAAKMDAVEDKEAEDIPF